MYVKWIANDQVRLVFLLVLCTPNLTRFPALKSPQSRGVGRPLLKKRGRPI